MLVNTSIVCECCNKKSYGILQELSARCLRCGKKFKICETCQPKGCPKCGGVLETDMQWAAKHNVLF